LGIEAVVPDVGDQKKVDLLVQGLLGDGDVEQSEKLLSEMVDFAGVDNVVLGCTDLQLVFHPSEKVIDSMQCLVNDTVNVLLGGGQRTGYKV
jgi:aspartate/glutamate racemase